MLAVEIDRDHSSEADCDPGAVGDPGVQTGRDNVALTDFDALLVEDTGHGRRKGVDLFWYTVNGDGQRLVRSDECGCAANQGDNHRA
jgi:hypothetical protein